MAPESSSRPSDLEPQSPRAARVVLFGVMALAPAVLVLAVLLWPSGTDIRGVQIKTWLWLWTHTGRHGWFTPELWSLVVNAGIFLLPACAITILTRARWWHVALGGLVVSAGVEVYQAMELAGLRVASADDVLANGSGALVGALLGNALRPLRLFRPLRLSRPLSGPRPPRRLR